MPKTLRQCLLAAACLLAVAAAPPTLPSEAPTHFTPLNAAFDYTRRDVMIPMRDGVHLKTVILIPNAAHDTPILLTRTPYGAVDRVEEQSSANLETIIGSGDVADLLMTQDGYIRVFQDIRGKKDSEGDFVMNRPLIGSLNPTKVDESTDAWDTIDWLVHHLPQSNGRVGILGISYDGYTTLMALFHPHPALKAAVPINAMVDGWRGDDWFHNGAFRTGSFPYVYQEEATRGSSLKWWSTDYDEYTEQLNAVSAGSWGRARGLDQLGFFTKLTSHPAYDDFWSSQAVDKLLAAQPLAVPTMLVHSLWDQEDIYGNMAVWTALKPHDTNHLLSMTIGPWFHHQERLDGTSIGAIAFGSDTAAWWRANVLKPFFDRTLKGDAHAPALPTVTAFQTGTDRWQSLPGWPACATPACHVAMTPIWLQPGLALGWNRPAGSDHAEVYTADPAKPVPFIPRPVHTSGQTGETAWQHWLTSDQRDAAARPDVLSWSTLPLSAPVTLAGQPVANIVESITGTDQDIVVKLIDVYPPEMGRDPVLGGYQFMVAADILRGRYRTDRAHPAAITPNTPLAYHFALPPVNHVFLPGHRLMVQIQSSWFPLYDRNPQTYVPNIFWAQASDYKPQTVTVWDAGSQASSVSLPVVK